MAERQKPSSFSHSLLRFFAFVPSWIPSQNLRTGEAKDDTGKLFLSSYSDATNASFIDARKRKSSKRNNDSKDSFDEISRRIRGRVESQPSWFRIFLYDWIPHVCSISLYALISIHPYIDFAIVPSTFPFDISILKSRCIIQSVRSKIELRDMLNIYRKRNSIFYFKLFIDNLFATNLHNNILRSKDNNHEEMLNIESCARKASFEAWYEGVASKNSSSLAKGEI